MYVHIIILSDKMRHGEDALAASLRMMPYVAEQSRRARNLFLPYVRAQQTTMQMLTHRVFMISCHGKIYVYDFVSVT